MWDNDIIREIWNNHRGKFLGLLLGFLFGLVVITFDFVKALVLTFFIALGFIIGKKLDNKEDLWSLVERFIGSRSR